MLRAGTMTPVSGASHLADGTMFDAWQMATVLGVLLALVFSGMHIAVALGITATLGIYLMTGDIEVVRTFIAEHRLRGVARLRVRRHPAVHADGRFPGAGAAPRATSSASSTASRAGSPAASAVATVLANAVFAFVTGVSIAAAAAFSRIAYPEMKRHGYERDFALGCIAGSACLGMLIPPSVLMIVWGVLTEQAIGKLFIAGILPGFLVVAAYTAYIVVPFAILKPHRVGEREPRPRRAPATAAPPKSDEEFKRALVSTLCRHPAARLSACSAASGSAASRPPKARASARRLALLVALFKGMRAKEIFEVILSVGRTSAPLLLLLVMAQLYCRVLSMTGITGAVQALVPQFRPAARARSSP